MTRRKYHQSEIKTFLKCGKQWEFRYLLGIKTPPNAARTIGSAVDKAVTHNLVQKVKTGQDVSMEEVLDTYATDFTTRAQETEWGEDRPDDQKDIGAQLVKLHHENVAPKIEPATVQEEFIIETDAGYDLGGTLDLTEKSGIIADTKTSSRAYAENAVADDIQPAMYDFAYEALHKKPAEGFRFDVLIKPTKKNPPRLQQVQGKVTHENRQWLFEAITQMDRAIQAGVTLPAPEGAWWCSKDWCGYWDRCKGRGRK
jgi:CRISPR/Cas system-associated exonuclease Cas4 (RecB family)